MQKFQNLPKGLLKVDNPDHPFTFDGPDTLLSDTNGLLAIFNVRANEQINPTKLFSRLTNSLIAYPASTQMLLLIDKNDNILNKAIVVGDQLTHDRMRIIQNKNPTDWLIKCPGDS